MNTAAQRSLTEPLRSRDWLFILFLFSIHFEYLYVRLGVSDTIFKPYRLLAIAAVLAYLPHALNDITRVRHLFAPIAFAMVYAIAITAFASREHEILNYLLLPATNLIMLFAAMSASSTRALKLGLAAFCVGVGINIAYGITAFAADQYRLVGFYRNPNHLGVAIACAVIILVYQLPRWLRFWRIAILAYFVCGIVLSGSRGAILATALSIVMISIADKRRRLMIVGIVVLGSACVWLLMDPIMAGLDSLNNGRLRERYSQQELTRAAGRLEIARSALYVGTETSFIGIGINRYQDYHRSTLRKLRIRDSYGIALGTHNFYISLLVEWGVPALLAFLVFFFRAFKSRLAVARHFIFGAVVMVAVFGATTDLVSVVGAWVVLGLFLRMESMAIESGSVPLDSERVLNRVRIGDF